MSGTDTAPESATLRLDGHRVKVSSLDRVMYPDTGFTKSDVIDYYRAVAGAMLPQLRDRPVTQVRFPEGFGGDRFFQKNVSRYTPRWIRRFEISASPGSTRPAKQVRYPVIDDEAGLVWFANQAVLEMHTPQYRLGPRGGVRNPDRLVIDLDPGEGVGLDACAAVAHIVRERLAKDHLATHPVTSGGKGLHLYAAVDGKRTARKVHAWVQGIARELAERYPDLIVATVGKEARKGKVFLDWSQNHPARSTATPYTLRAKSGTPTVTAPRAWEEITEGVTQLGPAEVRKRLEHDGDLLERWRLR